MNGEENCLYINECRKLNKEIDEFCYSDLKENCSYKQAYDRLSRGSIGDKK